MCYPEDNRFEQCLDAPAAQLHGLQEVLQGDILKYADLKDRSKAALKSCLVNFPSSCPNTTTTCMNTQIDYFNSIAKGLTDNRIVRSSCMGKFVEALQCFSKSVENVLKKTKTVQKKTTACISFEDNSGTRQSMLAFVSIFQSLVVRIVKARLYFNDKILYCLLILIFELHNYSI